MSPGCSRKSAKPYYARLGFEKVPMDEVTVNITLKEGAPAMLVRAGTERDYDDICAMHATRTAGALFALRRDPAALHYAVSKKRLFAGLSAPGTHALEFFVAEEGTSAAAYVVLSQNQHGWTLEEAGDRDPAGARLGGMLQVLAAREPSRPSPLIRAWWPRSFPVPPQVSLSRRTDSKDIFMIRSLDAGLCDLRGGRRFLLEKRLLLREGYDPPLSPGEPCHCRAAIIWARTTSSTRSAPAGWARCTAPGTAGSGVTSR